MKLPKGPCEPEPPKRPPPPRPTPDWCKTGPDPSKVLKRKKRKKRKKGTSLGEGIFGGLGI